LSQALAGAEADKLKKFIDAGGHKFSGCPTLAEAIFESRVVYISSGGHREGETPDPIPNSAVKTLVADGTRLKRRGE
jgi:hypothetical protein